ncbi:uncharacterized protein LOC134179730 isoform X2 [Corticium candelabrum]|nr:uncharacterized protein LOC134179730 isoform X2 [Corticium candelabrum]
MAPRYMEDKSFGSSLYKTDFDGKKRWNDWTTSVGPHGKLISPEERKKTTNYLRATHFQFGHDAPTVATETADAYGTVSDGLSKTGVPGLASDRGTTHVFRAGDYNVEGRPGSYVSVHMSDFGQQTAAGVSTVIPKAYGHVLPKETPSSNLAASALRHALQQQNYNHFSNPRDPVSVNLLKAFTKYDRDRSGFITFDELQLMCLDLMGNQASFSEQELRDLLRECDQNEDGQIDYNEFFRFLVCQSQPVAVDGAFVSSQQESYRKQEKDEKLMQNVKRRLHEDPIADGNYQISTHFQFGTNEAFPSSVYTGDYTQMRRPCVKPDRCPPPISSKMIPEEPDRRTGMPTQRRDYVDHSTAQTATSTEQDVSKNKERHKLQSVAFSCNPHAYSEDRQKSVTQLAYCGKTSLPAERLLNSLPQYKHLQSDEALLVPPREPKESEAQSRFVPPITSVELAAQKRRESRMEMKERLKDNKQTHFPFGFDPDTKISEQKFQFESRPPVDSTVPAAGVSGTTHFSHVTPSEAHGNDGSGDSLSGGVQNEIVKKTYERHLNPRDPIHMNLRMAFLEFDTDLSGKISRQEIMKVCEKYNIEIDPVTLNDILKRCDQDGDGMVDYNEFQAAFSRRRSSDGMFETVMKGDYKPIQQRQFTEMQKQVIAADQSRTVCSAQTHFFHTDHSNNPHLSTTTNDFIKPEMMHRSKAAAL